MNLLRIYFSSSWQDSASPCAWALCDASGAVLEQGVAPLSALPKADEAAAIIAAPRVTCVNVKSPKQSRRRWEAALPFVAEEFTLTDPEDNHVVPCASQPDGTRNLLIYDKRWLGNIFAACQATQINLRRAVPEMLLATLPANSWALIWNGHEGFVRTGLNQGSTLDFFTLENTPVLFKLSLADKPRAIEIRYSSEIKYSLPSWPEISLTQGKVWDWKREPLEPSTANLLWGEFAPKTHLGEQLVKFRPLLILVLLALTIEAVGSNLQWLKLAQEKRQLVQQIERDFHQAFGESSALVNPTLQMQRNLAALRHSTGLSDDSDFLPLLDNAASGLATIPANNIKGMHYEAGLLDVDMQLTNSAELNALQQKLRSRGLLVRASAPQELGAGRIATRLSLQAGGMP